MALLALDLGTSMGFAIFKAPLQEWNATEHEIAWVGATILCCIEKGSRRR